MTSAQTTLPVLADQINAAFCASESARVLAGRLLIEARGRIEADFPIQRRCGSSSGTLARKSAWVNWCGKHIERSMADIRKCMALARSADPEAAAAAERLKARIAMAEGRALDRANVSAFARGDEPPALLQNAGDSVSRRDEVRNAPYIPFCANSSFNMLHNMGGAGENVAHTHVEWYTPLSLFAALGNPSFDLDPASPGARDCHVPAARHLTKADDGLATEWSGFVWLNPPFGKRNGLQDFAQKFIRHDHGVMLIPCYASNRWWHDVVSAVDAVLFLAKRMKFINGRPGEGSQSFGIIGVCLVAVGDRGVEVLRTGSRNGLGVLMKPDRVTHQRRVEIDSTDMAEEIAPLEIDELSEAAD